MGAPGPQNKVQNFMQQHSSGKHVTIHCYNKGKIIYLNTHKSCPCYSNPLYNMQASLDLITRRRKLLADYGNGLNLQVNPHRNNVVIGG